MRFTNSPYDKMRQQKPRSQAPAPVFRVSLLARDWLRVLLPRAYAGPGWREVTAWPVN